VEGVIPYGNLTSINLAEYSPGEHLCCARGSFKNSSRHWIYL